MPLHSPSLLLSQNLGLWIETLYQQAQKQPVSTFKSWCFTSLTQLIEFDSGLWGTRSDVMRLNLDHWVEDAFVHNQPDSFMANYFNIAARSKATDSLNQHLMANPERFFSIWESCPPEQWYQTDYYLEHCKQFKVENAISAVTVPTEHSVIGHVFSFYRAQRDNDFSANDVLMANFLLPHLVEAFRINVLSSFGQSKPKQGVVRAVVDRFGEIIEAEQGFYGVMKEKHLLDKSRVNITQLSDITSSSQLKLSGLILDISFNDGVFYLEASEGSLIDKLTPRQKEVCQLMIKGLNNQEIANLMTKDENDQPLKANTVNAHIRNVFKVLRVSSKAAATSYLIRQGFSK